MLTPRAIPTKTTLIHHCLAIKTAQYNKVIQTRLTETILTRNGIALYSLKLRIYSPRYGCASNQSYNFLELRKKSVAESRRNGVVGSTGRNIPTTPKTSDNIPNKSSMYFIYLLISLQIYAK